MNIAIHAAILATGIGLFYYIINYATEWIVLTAVYGLFSISALVGLICIGTWIVSKNGGFTAEEKDAMKTSPTVSFLTLDSISVISIAVILYTSGYTYTCFIHVVAYCLLLSLVVKYFWMRPKGNDLLDETITEVILEEWSNCNFKKVAKILDQLDRRQTADAIYLISKTYGSNDARIAVKLVCD